MAARKPGCRARSIRDTNLYYFGTGNPTPAFMTGPRGPGDHLFTNSLMAVNVDTGKMAWAYQTSPRDTHDWDSAQTPVLYDGEFNGRPRKLDHDGGAQRVLLRARPGDRRAPVDEHFR